MPAVAAETPEKPKKPATSYTTKKIIAHFSMLPPYRPSVRCVKNLAATKPGTQPSLAFHRPSALLPERLHAVALMQGLQLLAPDLVRHVGLLQALPLLRIGRA